MSLSSLSAALPYLSINYTCLPFPDAVSQPFKSTAAKGSIAGSLLQVEFVRLPPHVVIKKENTLKMTIALGLTKIQTTEIQRKRGKRFTVRCCRVQAQSLHICCKHN